MEQPNSDSVTAKPKSQQQINYGDIDNAVKQIQGAEAAKNYDPVGEAQKQNRAWHSITDNVTMNFRGKKMNFNDIVKHVHTVCNIDVFNDLPTVRNCEQKIGNLIADIYIQKSKAQYAHGKLESQRVARLGMHIEIKDRRSMSAIEARLSSHDDLYKSILELQSDCKSTLDFWHDMYNICLRTTDRLKQISMALMAEMKL